MLKIVKKYKSILFIVGGFFLGASLSSGLLLYSGKELVNVLVYFAFVVAIPALLSIFGFIVYFFFKHSNTKLEALKSSSLTGVFFSLGALLSLLITIATKDIAFGWATTLNIQPSELKSVLDSIAIWKAFCTNCVPDTHLIELSRYSRLGSSVTKEQIANAQLLGQWWKFLALSIVVYGVALRGILFAIANILPKQKESVEFSSNIAKEEFEQLDSSYENRADFSSLKSKEFKLVGYHFDSSKLDLNSSDNSDNIVVATKSWEPPIMDFFDYLEELQDENPNAKISILLVGLNGKPKSQDVDIWTRKLKELNLNYEVIA